MKVSETSHLTATYNGGLLDDNTSYEKIEMKCFNDQWDWRHNVVVSDPFWAQYRFSGKTLDTRAKTPYMLLLLKIFLFNVDIYEFVQECRVVFTHFPTDSFRNVCHFLFYIETTAQTLNPPVGGEVDESQPLQSSYPSTHGYTCLPT